MIDTLGATASWGDKFCARLIAGFDSSQNPTKALFVWQTPCGVVSQMATSMPFHALKSVCPIAIKQGIRNFASF